MSVLCGSRRTPERAVEPVRKSGGLGLSSGRRSNRRLRELMPRKLYSGDRAVTGSLFISRGVPTSALKVLLNAASSENPAQSHFESERSEVESSVFAIVTRCK